MMAVLESPIKSSVNNIRKTSAFRRRTSNQNKLTTDFKSLERTLTVGNSKLKRIKSLPKNKKIDKLTLMILSSRRNEDKKGTGTASAGLGFAVGRGVGAVGSGLMGLAGGAVDLVGGLFDRGAKKGAQKGVQKGAQKATSKAATKAAGKGIGKGLLKKLPLVGLGLGAAFALERAAGGDMVGALGELASGAAAMVPGWGTAASVAIDAGLIARDIDKSNKNDKKVEEKLDEKRKKLLGPTSTRAVNGLLPALNKFEKYVENFKSFSVSGSFNQDIAPGTATDSMGSKNPNMHTGDYPGFDTMERVAPFVTGHVSTYPGAQFGASRGGGTRTHLGQDIDKQDPGDPVLSIMKGTVTEVGTGFRFQNGQGTSQTIGIQHPDGTMSRYVHVLSDVSVGDEVLTGQKIGTVSPADVASSKDFPHLHFELYAKGGGVIDPRPFLNSAPKGTPAVAPIAPNGETKIKPERDGADDRESAPMDPTVDPGNDGYDMTRTREGFLRSEVMDDDTGFTRGDMEDMRVAKERRQAMVKALGRDGFAQALDNLGGNATVENYSAMMKAAGMEDQLKDILQQYRPGQLIDSGAAASTRGLVANDPMGRRFSAEAQAILDYEIPKLETYPTYNQEGGSPTFIIMDSGGQSQPQSRPSPPQTRNRGKSETVFVPIGGGGLNRTMDEMLLTKLSRS
tara:strand:- start:389 stop:2428 length:2040 start_codon:yes stop_codon:yes gene_type:complete